MIISPKYKAVFIANPKCGSMTVHKTLRKCIEDEELIEELLNPDKHMPCSELMEKSPQYENYFKFAFVRNPWHRVVSWYFFEKAIPGKNFKDASENKLKRDTSNISFKEFITNTWFRDRVWANRKQFQYKFTKDCDFIGKTENLQEDFNIVCDKIGISHTKLILANTHLHNYNTKHEHYTKYYDDETREIVAKVFAEDINYFNYEFDK